MLCNEKGKSRTMQIYWVDHAQTILYMVIDGHWAWDEFHAMRTLANAMIAAQPYTIHIVVDLNNNQTMPRDLARQVRPTIGEMPDNVGLIVVIGAGILTQTLYTLVKRVFFSTQLAGRLRLVRTLEDALRLIAEYSPPSPDST